MAEPRRVSLTTLPLSAPVRKKKKEEKEDEEGEGEEEDRDQAAATSRFRLALFESSEKNCPEFYYPELIRARKKAANKHSDDPFNDEKKEEEKIEALAKKFEEKYYDELVPASLTTKLGGFYINSGTLQFRQASDSEVDDDYLKEKKKLKSPKKRKLKDGSEKMKKKRKEDGHEKEKKSQKSKISKQAGFMPLNSHKEEKKKKKKYMGALGVREMLKQFEKEKEALKKREDQWNLPTLQTVARIPHEANSGSINISVSDPLLSLIGSANESDLLQVASTVDLEIDLDQFLNDSSPESPLNDFDESSDPLPAFQCSLEGQTSRPVPTLPDRLPAVLEKRIKDLTQAAKASGEGKQKFFTQDINNILLDIELQSRVLNSQARSGVYAHLASFLPCSKDTLVKRAKKLHLNEQDGRLKEPLQRLQEAIARAMPYQVAKYQDECQAHSQARMAKMLGEDKDQKERTYSDEDDDDEKMGKRVMGPRKKFHWNDGIRDLLCNVVRIKMASYEPERNQLQAAEDFLKAFLESEVKPLWPKGWMQARMLFKESRKVHAHITSIPTKKKIIPAPKAKVKDQILKTERKFVSSTPVNSGSATCATQGLGNISVTPINVSISSNAAQSSSSTTTPQSFSLDDSLDGDMTNNHPSLEDVSEALAALNDAAGGSKDFSSIVSNSMSDKIPAVVSSEEKKTVQKSLPPSSAPSPVQSHSSLNLLAEQALALGQLSQERTSDSITTGLVSGFKSHSSPANSKSLTETLQTKQKHLCLQRTPPLQVQSHMQSHAAKQYHPTSQPQKSYSSSPSYSISKLQSSSQTKTTSQVQQRPLIQHLKNPAKTHSFYSVSSSLSTSMQTSPSSQRTLGTSTLSASYTAKHANSLSSSNQTFKSPMTIVATKHSAPSGNPIQSASSVHSSISSSSHLNSLNRRSSTPSQATNRQSPNISIKKPSISQKLTLVAPPGGSNGDSSSGTQGVAKLLTSSLKPSVTASTATGAMLSLQAATGTGLLANSPSLNLLSTSFNTANPKITTAALSQASLGMMPGIVPMHFTFPTVLIGSDSTSKAGVSTDAIVTGPAPGTFHHGLAHSIFAGLHSTPHHAVQLPHPVLPTHIQQSLQDGNQIHGETSNMQRKIQ
eukprot:gi/632973262/ref/XP_007903068.1/ PREDICTED: ubinuclein-1 isoform X2 [Callorhinchus milii]